jgi:CubicO group peptidase (beta-lactamase class C family)
MVESAVRRGSIGAASILIARRGTIVLHKGFGHLSSEAGSPAVEPDSVYIVASLTKPVTAAALMILVQRGEVSLSEPVSTYLPEFKGGERSKVRVVDLLTHTSGLPDQLAEVDELRHARAPLSEFVKATYATPLLFTPGTAWQYSSMGILLAAQIVERIAGLPIRDFEQKEIFGPLGMEHTSLGLGRMKVSDTVQIPNVGDSSGFSDPVGLASCGDNSEYWRNIRHPWGGMHATTMDLAIMLQTFLNGGSYGGKRVLSRATVKAMTSDQNGSLNAPWGLGWELGRSQGRQLGDLVSPSAIGHLGASGTMEWADPETQTICVLLTNHPFNLDNGLFLRRFSNAVAASIQ